MNEIKKMWAHPGTKWNRSFGLKEWSTKFTITQINWKIIAIKEASHEISFIMKCPQRTGKFIGKQKVDFWWLPRAGAGDAVSDHYLLWEFLLGDGKIDRRPAASLGNGCNNSTVIGKITAGTASACNPSTFGGWGGRIAWSGVWSAQNVTRLYKKLKIAQHSGTATWEAGGEDHWARGRLVVSQDWATLSPVWATEWESFVSKQNKNKQNKQNPTWTVNFNVNRIGKTILKISCTK